MELSSFLSLGLVTWHQNAIGRKWKKKIEVSLVQCSYKCFPTQLLTNHYERCWKYYCLPGGWGNFGAASEEELHLSRKLFWGIFDALSQKVIYPVSKGNFIFCGFLCIIKLLKNHRFLVRKCSQKNSEMLPLLIKT